MKFLPSTLAALLATGLCAFTSSAEPLRVLFLGDNAGHRPTNRFALMQPALAPRGIEMTYTDRLDSLNITNLTRYDALVIYANHTRISPEQEKALLDYVEGGHGFVPVHCASFCFLNSPSTSNSSADSSRATGREFSKRRFGNSEHPVMKGLTPIESWDESYVHSKHNTNRVVLAERRDDKGNEPYTWVREAGKGRVFYTAWGHDQRTWSNPQFIELLDRGIRWAVGGKQDLSGKP